MTQDNFNTSQSSPYPLDPIIDQAPFFKTLFEKLPLPTLIADFESGMLLWGNPAALSLTGYTLDELRKLHHTRIHPPEEENSSKLNFRNQEKSEFHLSDGISILSKDGKKIPVEITHTNFDWNGGKIKVGIFKDASRRPTYEKNLLFLQSLIDSIPLPIFYKNANGQYIGCNKAFCDLLGFDKKMILGKTVFDMAPPEFSQKYHDADQALFRSREAQVYESVILTAQNKKIHVRFHKVLLHLDSPAPDGILGVIEDLSESKRLLNILTEAKEAAEQAAKIKNDFLSTMSHEIRTPLNGIIGMTDILMESQLSERDREYLSVLRQSADALLNIVSNILDSARMDENKFELEKIPIKLEQVIHDIVEILRPSADKKKLKLLYKFDPSIPASLIGDPGRIAQIIVNLLSNSIKFTEKGIVSIETCLKSIEKQNANIQIQVIDTGIGIPPEIIPKLFLPVNQVDNIILKKYGGTGLGLSVARRIINMMGGEVTIRSDVGKGTILSFILQLPLPVGASIPEPIQASTSGQMQILVSEDDPTNQLVISSILKKSPYGFQIAENGMDVLEKVRNTKFDLILMDVQMPIMDGLEATRNIRRMPPPLCNTPIIALTADASRENAERCISAGMNGFIEKPIKKTALLDELKNIFEHKDSFHLLPSTTKSFLPTDNLLDMDFLGDLQSAFEKEDFNILIDTFAETADGQLKRLEISLQRHQHKDIERIAHTLKGSSSNVGAIKLSKLAANICTAYHESRFDEMEVMATGLQDILSATISSLRKRKIN